MYLFRIGDSKEYLNLKTYNIAIDAFLSSTKATIDIAVINMERLLPTGNLS